ncbi:MAG: hypothetical protein A3C49_00995 [Candidatus Doudnabacteria bacterium RIFCSPHIGHO2_02_FULL_42_25]|nr:MAG: hypothetical protein A3E28_03370 [Candidatus Doudnabacteria bacterium RIFCSPHIGHO2_12_FULL_42_22]OGE87297.1 MAG: hypothetical protein A3C49_00995 [Candidatus Doudnabacteria bacterium RIFCSPHIGHO2_02_FULL_42_25]
MEITQPQQPSFFKGKGLIYVAIGCVLLLLGVGAYVIFGNKQPAVQTPDSVSLVIEGPDQLVSGNEAEYRVVYKNDENADLTNISLQLFYPTGFKFKSSTPQATSSVGNIFNLPVLKEGKEAEIIIRGKLTGGTGESKQIKAVMHYRLSNFNSEFAAETTIQTSILPPNLTMEINGPIDVVGGQDTTFSVNFTNVTSQDFDNLVLIMTYPEGFNYTSSNIPVTKDNNYWKLPKIATGSSLSLEITGSFTGENSEVKLVKAELGQIINNIFASQLISTGTFQIMPSALALTLSSDVEDGIVNLDQTISFTLNYANQGSIGLNNIVVVVNLEGASLDIPRLQADNAILSDRTLTWKAATLPGLSVLSPMERGEIDFRIPIVDSYSTNLKNQTIKATAQISSDEIQKPTRAGDVVLKLGSELTLNVHGDYVSGAAPLQVGKTTLFNMTLMLSNGSNDLSNTKVVASLPLPSQSWKNVVVPDAEKNRLTYDPNSGKITWNIGDIPAFTGKFIPVARVSFQIAVTPSEVDRNKAMNLLSNIKAMGTDVFTSQLIETNTVNEVTTSTINDDVLDSRGGGTVQ